MNQAALQALKTSLCYRLPKIKGPDKGRLPEKYRVPLGSQKAEVDIEGK